MQGMQISHFLYADDLVLLSLTKEGLQLNLDRLNKYAEDNGLKINVNKTKTMVFNYSGRLIWHSFSIGNKRLQQVQTFCYLGFEVKASGIVKLAAQTLYDKANKGMRPLMGAVARFNILVRTSLRLFHTYISPIALTTSENWMSLSKRKLESFSPDTILMNTFNDKIDILHRTFLKYILGTSKRYPNMAVLYMEKLGIS